MAKTPLGRLDPRAFGMLELPRLDPQILHGFRALGDLTGTTSDAMDECRINGVVPGSIPATEHVARFIRACYAANVGFKATAGLHHPLRSEHGLSYEADAPRDVMHGFLNVFLTAAFHYNGLTARDTIDLLNATTLDGITMDDDKLAWREYVVTRNEVSTVRRRFATAFGSCSFTEPVDDLINLELLT